MTRLVFLGKFRISWIRLWWLVLKRREYSVLYALSVPAPPITQTITEWKVFHFLHLLLRFHIIYTTWSNYFYCVYSFPLRSNVLNRFKRPLLLFCQCILSKNICQLENCYKSNAAALWQYLMALHTFHGPLLHWANEGKPIGNMKIMIVIMTDVAFDFCTRMHDPWIMCK